MSFFLFLNRLSVFFGIEGAGASKKAYLAGATYVIFLFLNRLVFFFVTEGREPGSWYIWLVPIRILKLFCQFFFNIVGVIIYNFYSISEFIRHNPRGTEEARNEKGRREVRRAAAVAQERRHRRQQTRRVQ